MRIKRTISVLKNAAAIGNFNNDGAKGEKSLAVGMDVHANGATSVAVG